MDQDYPRSLERRDGEKKGKFLALAAVVAMMAMAGFATDGVFAKSPKQSDPNIDKLVWNGTAHAKPGFLNPDLNCKGHRLFFALSQGNTLGNMTWVFDPAYTKNVELVDWVGAATEFHVDQDFAAVIYVVLRGANGSNLHLVCTDQFIDDDLDDLCEVGDINLTRGNGIDTVKLTTNLVEDDYEEVLWQFDGNWRMFQIKVYSLK